MACPLMMASQYIPHVLSQWSEVLGIMSSLIADASVHIVLETTMLIS